MATPLFTMSTKACIFVSCFAVITLARPERGKWIDQIDKDHLTLFYVKSMYSHGEISVGIHCQSKNDIPLNIRWLVRRSPCATEFVGLNTTSATMYLDNPGSFMSPSYNEFEYLFSTEKVSCGTNKHFYLGPYNSSQPYVISRGEKVSTKPKSNGTAATVVKVSNKMTSKSASVDAKPTKQAAVDTRRKREAASTGNTPNPTSVSASSGKKKENFDGETFMKLWKDGYYLMVIKIEKPLPPDDFSAEVTVRMMWDNNYISAVDWPLLIFYGIMGLVYIGFGIFWLFMLACNWRDLLRIQFWVGAVILLGMLEKAVFFAEYENINNEGQPVQGAIILAELVSCAKRGLARMLVIIVCLGFGIVKPRLGQTLHKVLIAGIVYIILASIEGCMRATKARPDQSSEWMFAAVPLAVTDAIICWWIFSALLQTTRTLRLRRNVVKLSLYRHFTNTLIFAIIASIAYMIWFMTQHRFKQCITDWKELWVDEAFWHLLFSVILFIIMILWRPTANNQRYAFSPLLDAAEDDLDDDQVLSDAYEGMKMRTTKIQQRNGSPRGFEDSDRKLEDDLKWVEENIPSSIADKLLPALDSDEEIMNQKFEVSKME